MDYKKVFWGVIFILIGLLFVLKNLNILNFSWYQFLNLWPLLLVLWGIALLPIKGFVKLILSLAMVVLGIYLVNRYDSGSWFEFHGPRAHRHYEKREWRDTRRDRDIDRDVDREDAIQDSQYLYFPYSADIKKATLKLDAAAGTFNIRPVSQELIEVTKDGNIGSYSLTSQEAHDRQIVKLTLEEGTIRGQGLRHQVDIRLHEKPVWDIDLSIGAARIEMDLSPFKTNNINVDGGASSIRLKLGDRQEEVNVDVNAGASSIVIEVPKNAGCQVKTSTVLSGKNMRDFKKTDSGNYQTDNFEESENKIFIKVDVAVSKIEIKRY